MTPVLSPASVRATEPPKRWRPWWLITANDTFTCDVCKLRRYLAAGDFIGSHCSVFPSRDVAETVGVKVAHWPQNTGRVRFLCALPDGERP